MNEKCHLRPKLRDASSGEIAGEMMLGGINPARFVGPISYTPTIFKSGNKYKQSNVLVKNYTKIRGKSLLKNNILV